MGDGGGPWVVKNECGSGLARVVFNGRAVAVPGAVSEREGGTTFLSLKAITGGASLTIGAERGDVDDAVTTGPRSMTFFVFGAHPFRFGCPVITWG